LADFHGIQVVKHTHGEFGLTAAAFQQLLLAIPNAALGHQQTCCLLSGDILMNRIPIRSGPNWGLSDVPGIGWEVDEDALRKYHELFREQGEYACYGNQFPLK
jgi:glucarate dehydratase